MQTQNNCQPHAEPVCLQAITSNHNHCLKYPFRKLLIILTHIHRKPKRTHKHTHPIHSFKWVYVWVSFEQWISSIFAYKYSYTHTTYNLLKQPAPTTPYTSLLRLPLGKQAAPHITQTYFLRWAKVGYSLRHVPLLHRFGVWPNSGAARRSVVYAQHRENPHRQRFSMLIFLQKQLAKWRLKILSLMDMPIYLGRIIVILFILYAHIIIILQDVLFLYAGVGVGVRGGWLSLFYNNNGVPGVNLNIGPLTIRRGSRNRPHINYAEQVTGAGIKTDIDHDNMVALKIHPRPHTH